MWLDVGVLDWLWVWYFKVAGDFVSSDFPFETYSFVGLGCVALCFAYVFLMSGWEGLSSCGWMWVCWSGFGFGFVKVTGEFCSSDFPFETYCFVGLGCVALCFAYVFLMCGLDGLSSWVPL